jgi:ABC-type lipoprotein export system ATPase subunit
MADTCMEARGLAKIYGEAPTALRVFENIDFSVESGQFTVLMGPSGSGKSTLLNILGLLDKPSSGDISLDGTPVLSLSETEQAALRSRKIGFIFQFDSLMAEFSVLENIEIPALLRGQPNPPHSLQLLEQFGLASLANKFPAQLSGGERQRAAIARALRNRPSIIFADEPTGNLDNENARRVFEDLRRLAHEGVAVLMATHNNEALRYGDRIFNLTHGKLNEVTPAAFEQGL